MASRPVRASSGRLGAEARHTHGAGARRAIDSVAMSTAEPARPRARIAEARRNRQKLIEVAPPENSDGNLL